MPKMTYTIEVTYRVRLKVKAPDEETAIIEAMELADDKMKGVVPTVKIIDHDVDPKAGQQVRR